MTKVGGGTLTIASNQTATAAFNVNEGTVALSAGLEVARPIVVASGATLSVDGTEQVNVASLDLAAGSTLDIASYTAGIVPLAVVTGATLPGEGTVALTFNGGAFASGVYAIYAKAGVTAADGAKFTPSTDGEDYEWSVVGDSLVLKVGTVAGNVWTGLAGDGRISTGANWAGGTVPAAGADIDFSGVSSALTIIADTGSAYGAVTMGDGLITFTNSLAASSISCTMNVAVAPGSTVTIDGDLETDTQYVVRSIGAGGRFVVTDNLTVDNCDVLVDSNKGAFIVGGKLKTLSTSNTRNTYTGRSVDTDAVVEFEALESATVNKNTCVSSSHTVIGNGGLDVTGGFDTLFSIPVTLYARDAGYAVNSSSGAYYDLKATTITLNTTRYGTQDTPATVTVNAVMRNYNSSNKGGVSVTGCGKVVFNSVSTFTEGLTVSNTATVAVNAGKRPGNGMVTVSAGATLEVAESVTAQLEGGLTLADGACLGFNFTSRSTAPTLAVASGKTMTANGAVTVKVDGVRPKGGTYVLTTCGGFDAEGVSVTLAADAPEWVENLSVNVEGNLVLDVKPKGMVIVVK